MDTSKKIAAVLALCVGVCASWEGLRTKAYQDAAPARNWTYCYGETEGATKDTRATPQECRDLLAARIEGDFVPAVEACITREMPVKVEAAFVSMAYNIGTGAFCKSSVARKWNAGDLVGACDAMLLYVRAGGVVLKGLVNRRNGESQLCKEGIT